MLPFIVSVTLSGLVRISKTKYVSLERPTFADVFAYQFFTKTESLLGPARNVYITPYGD